MLIPISFPADEHATTESEQKIKDLKRIIYNFKMQRSEILLRIGTIFKRQENEEIENAQKKRKISASEASSSSSGDSSRPRARTYNELESVLTNLGKVQESTGDSILEILFCCNGVKLYYIEQDSEVVSSLEEFVLRIIKLGSDFEKNLDETIFLQLIKSSETSIEIGQEIDENGEGTSSQAAAATEEPQPDPSFIYPLIPGVSPMFRTKFNAFVLPDLQSNDGSAIGMMIPTEYDDLVLDILITILKGVVKENGEIEFGDFTTIGDESQRAKRSTGDKFSENLVSGAYWVSQGIVKSAQKTGEFIDYSTPYILSKVQQAGDNAPPVSTKVNTSVTVAKSISGYAAQGTSFLAEKVGSTMSSFGRFLAPHVQQQGAKLLTYTTGMETERAACTMTETLKIASGAAEAISTIYSGLETSASILGRNIADNSVKVVRHKYGESYGEVSEKSFDTVGNLIAVNRSFNILTPKGLVKSTAKSAGKGILAADEFKPKVYVNKDYFTGTPSLIPNLDNFVKELNKPKS
jgi:spartin